MNKTKGFTLIETLVAISLLTMGVVGSFSLMQKVTSFTSTTSSQLVASYLAQEGIEIVRNIRDANYLSRQVWDIGLGASADYRLDYRSTVFPDATCGNYLRPSGNFYICSTDSGSKFQRRITITKPTADQMTVLVEVSWSERGVSHQVSAATELRNWR